MMDSIRAVMDMDWDTTVDTAADMDMEAVMASEGIRMGADTAIMGVDIMEAATEDITGADIMEVVATTAAVTAGVIEIHR